MSRVWVRPKELTEEQKKERSIKKEMQKRELEALLKMKEYDRPTVTIAKVLGAVSFGLAKTYLWRPTLFNSAIVELSGLGIYYAFLPILSSAVNIYIAITFTAAISFFAKFIMYSNWMFKKQSKVSEILSDVK